MPLEAEESDVRGGCRLFRHPDTQRNATWKLRCWREEFGSDKPRIFTAEHNQLRLKAWKRRKCSINNTCGHRSHRAQFALNLCYMAPANGL